MRPINQLASEEKWSINWLVLELEHTADWQLESLVPDLPALLASCAWHVRFGGVHQAGPRLNRQVFYLLI